MLNFLSSLINHSETCVDRQASVNTCCGVCVAILTCESKCEWVSVCSIGVSVRSWWLGERRGMDCEIKSSCSRLQRSLSWNNSLRKVTLLSWAQADWCIPNTGDQIHPAARERTTAIKHCCNKHAFLTMGLHYLNTKIVSYYKIMLCSRTFLNPTQLYFQFWWRSKSLYKFRICQSEFGGKFV